MIVAIVVLAWVVIGVAVGLFEARRGHWSKLAVVTGILGPLAIPLATSWHRNRPAIATRTVQPGALLQGDLDVLVGIDGSAESMAAAQNVAGLLGPRLRRLTLAHVLDIETASHDSESLLTPGAWDEETAAEDELTRIANEMALRTGADPEAVILAGDPARALEAHAVEHDFSLIVIGARGRGLSRLVFGSCASRLAERSRVPVLFFTAAVETAPGERVVARSS